MSRFAKEIGDFIKLLDEGDRPSLKYTTSGVVLEYRFNGVISESDDNELTITHYITTRDIDRYGTIIDPKGVRLENFEKAGMPVFFNHGWDKLPIGRALWIKRNENGLIAKTKFLIDFYSDSYNEFIKNLYKAYKEGILRTWSIGFVPLRYHEEKINNVTVKIFDEVDLLEYSAVTIPANPHAVNLNSLKLNMRFDMNSEERRVPHHKIEYKLDDKSSWDKNKAIISLRKWASSDGSGAKDKIDWSKYAQGFAWYDEEEPGNFGAYKLPHHWAKEGELYVVKRGVFAAMAALLGARGGVDIPDEERKNVYNHLAKHYEEFGAEPPEFREYTVDELMEIFPDEYSIELKLREIEKKIEFERLYFESKINDLENFVNERLSEIATEEKRKILTSEELLKFFK